jgi:hypothetical protein
MTPVAADNEGGIESDLAFLQVLAVAALDVAHRVRNQNRDVEHGPSAPQIGGRVAGSAALVQHPDHSLRAGEVAGAQQDDDAIAATLEYGHLAELGDIVHAGMGARVRSENHPLVEHDADTVGHAMCFQDYRSGERILFCAGGLRRRFHRSMQDGRGLTCTVLRRLRSVR